MVMTCLPATAETGMMQDRTGTPPRWTVQAPHCAMPHPNLVPFRSSMSRSTQSRGISGGASTVADLPLIVNEMVIVGASGRRYACLLYTSDAADDLLCVD